MKKKLIVNADDFGFSANRNRGIVETLERGIVTSVSLLVNFPAAAEAIEYVKRAGTGVAVHLNLSERGPLSGSVPSLTDGTGAFCGKQEIRERARAGKIDPSEVERELTAQVARVADEGIRVTHLDGHQHIQVYPPMVGPVARVARKFGIRWIRCPVDDDLTAVPLPPERTGDLEEYRVLGEQARSVFAAEGLRFADHFRGATLARQVSREGTERMLRRLPDGVTEYMVHPGYPDPGDPFSGPAREEEVRILTDPALRRMLEQAGVERTHFGNLG